MLRSSWGNLARRVSPHLCRSASAATASRKREGDISDAFASLSSTGRAPLPERFRQLKCDLVRGHEDRIVESWSRLLRQLKRENDVIAAASSAIIPQVDFDDLEGGYERLKDEIKKRGALIVRGVIPHDEARAYKDEIEDYVARNPHTRGFPRHDPQVYELYWSGPQIKARSHPSLLRVQKHLMSFLWHTSSSTAQISLENPLSYADRLRIRQPGDASFSLGPHIDGGSVERWEKGGYGRGGVYDRIFQGSWEEYDPWDAGSRVDVATNRYGGLGACSVFRMWQGWMSMSATGPREGTLLVNPLMHMAMAYVLLRPFFKPLTSIKGPQFLHERNWAFTGAADMTSEIPGASPGHGQELTDELHPHLELERTMVHIPKIAPGDFVAWHADTIHSVDKVHNGDSDSSVLYIPVCPVTELNAEYLARQRDAFRRGTPGPDFPGGEGEARHVGRPTEGMMRTWTTAAGRQAFGLEKLVARKDGPPGERDVVERANAILGF